ncbi:MAG: D-alanyl-D-alanine carboxypeptidase [Clostridia bacterium]|nr:D-alanyl-D-alanine carboxypeptidase [Clostridia bacterium]
MDRIGKERYQSNEKVKIAAKLFLIISIFIIISLFITNGLYKTYAETPNSSMIVIEANSLKKLGGYNEDVKLPMASTTKIVTAIVAINNADLDSVVTVTKESVGVEGSSIYLKEGEKMTLRDMLYGLMLRSGNDSATAIALHVGKNMDNFVSMMNDYASGLGLQNTHFANPHGLHDDNHYTSAYDLAVMTAKAYESEEFKAIVSCKKYDVKASENCEARTFYNKNKILSLYQGGNGVKTGFTKKAGRCLVSAAERDGMQLICVALNRGDMWGESMGAMDKAFAEYEALKFAEKDTALFTLPSGKRIGVNKDAIYPVKKYCDANFSWTFIPEQGLSKKINIGDKVGIMQVYENNQLLFSADLYSMDNINTDAELYYLTHYEGQEKIEYDGKTEQVFGFLRSGFPSRCG